MSCTNIVAANLVIVVKVVKCSWTMITKLVKVVINEFADIFRKNNTFCTLIDTLTLSRRLIWSCLTSEVNRIFDILFSQQNTSSYCLYTSVNALIWQIVSIGFEKKIQNRNCPRFFVVDHDGTWQLTAVNCDGDRCVTMEPVPFRVIFVGGAHMLFCQTFYTFS